MVLLPVLTFIVVSAAELPESVRSPIQIIDDGENTLENVERALASLDAALSTDLEPRQRCFTLGYRSLAFLRLVDLNSSAETQAKLLEDALASADAAIRADPTCPDGYFYRGAVLGRSCVLRGIFNSLFLVGEIRSSFERALALDPSHLNSRVAIGMVDAIVPGIFGGSAARAEKTFREVLGLDPQYTAAMLELAQVLVSTGRRDEALRIARAVADHPAPSRPWEWRKFDRARAVRMISELQR